MTAKRFASFLRLSLIAMLLAGLFAQPGPVSAASLPAQINKQFTPLQIDAGGVSVLRVTVFNPNSFPLTSASWTDNLVGVQPGLFIANPAGVVNTCGGSVTAAPNTTTLSLTGGTVPAQVGSTPGQCYVEVNVSSVTPGNLINTIPANNLSSTGDDGGTPVSITNTTPASATITVIAVSPPSLSKSFSPNTIFTGQTSTMTIRLNNNDVDTNLTGASYTDTLPSGLVVATPNGVTATGCGPGVVSAISGGTTISLTGGTVTPSVDCVITVNVTGASGQYTNTIPAGPGGPGSLHTDQGVTNNSPASANLNVQPVAIAKSFSPSTVDAGDVSTLTITLQNPTGSAYTGASITDSLLSMGAGFTVAGPPSANTCGFTTITAPINGTSIAASGGTIPASATPPTPVGTCVLSIPVRAALTVSGTRTNTIPANTLTTTEGVTNYLPATANLAVRAALYGTKSYSPTAIPLGGTSTVTITLYNRSDTPLTSVAFTDTLPAGLTVSAPASPQCGGTVTNTASTVTLSGGTIPANGSCTIVFTVTSSVAGGPYVNTVDANTIANGQGVGNAAFSTPTGLTVSPSSTLPVRVTKAFQTNPITPGQPSRLRITLTAPVDTALSGLNIVDTLPTGLFVTTPNSPTDNCPGANVVAPINGDTISLTGATLNAGASCNIDVWVTATAPGAYTNTIPAGAISTTQGRTNDDPATASIRVTSLTATKAFYATVVQAGGRSTMTITLQNNVDSPLVNVSVTDNLPGTVANGIRVAAVPNASTTCGAGVITATPGSNIVSMTGGTVPAQVGLIPGLCTITVDVVGTDSTPSSPSTYTNTIPVANISGTVQNTGVTINPVANASAVLTIQNLTMGIVKGFNPVLVYGGAYSTMSIDLINPNTNTALTGIAFTDDMTLLGTGMKLANPVAFNTGTCGGTLTGNPGDASFSYSGGALPANSTCTLTLRVVMDINGNRTNRIPVGAVTTFNGVSNAFATEASLTNLPGVSINKNFNPSTVLTTQPSVLTITIKNTSNIPVSNMGLADNLPGTLPDGLEVANPANVTNTCGGTVTANPGSQTVQLVGGSLAELGNPGDTCAITVNVISTRPGVYINTIPSGALTSDGGITNNDPATDTLTVEAGVYSLGNRVWFDTNNDGLLNGTEVGADGVTVELYAADVSGAPTGASLGTAVTSSGGYYRFDNLPAGDYVVVIPSTQFASGGPLEGYWSSGTTISSAGAIGETAAPDPDNDVDNDDNGTRQTSGAFNGAVLSSAVTLGPGTNEPTGDNDPTANPEAGEAPNNQSNRTVDFGFYRQQLGNLVFLDDNRNGTFDAGDSPLAGATVQLYAADGVTEINVGPDGVLGTADDGPGGVTTDASGNYLFSGLPAGSYIVKVTPPAGYVSTIDTYAPADTTDPNANTDDNDNGVGTTPGQVSSNLVTLAPGDGGAASNNTVTDATGTTANPTLDFGFRGPLIDLSVTKAVSDATPMVATDITFTITITNSGPDTATGVQVTDALPAGFAYVSSSATQGTYNDATGIWDVGTLLVSQTATLTLTVTVNVTGPYANYVQVTRADQTDVDSTPGNNSTDEDDDDSVTVTPTQGSPSASKSLSGSNQAFTTNPNVAIGEIVEYTVTITIPPGVFPNSRLVDTMQSGLSFMECASITASSPALTTSAAGSFTGVCASPTVDDAGGGAPVDVGRRVAFDFGTLTNTSRVDQTLTIVYTAVVLDSAGNVSGTTLANGAVWSSDSGTQTLPPVFVFIVEPELSLEKSASTSLVSLNSKFKITLTIQHTAASQTNAYDAVLTDVLPLELELVTGTLECVSGAQNADTCTYDAATRTVRAVWNNFALGGGNGRVTFFVRVTSLPPGGVSNTAYLLWTSLPGDVSVPQNSNIFSKERDYDPGSAIDVYGVSDTVTVGVFSGTPATGFAPNVVTDLSQAPKETYAQTGGVMLEIPSLGINIPIVGVPLKNGEWNVTWLGNQAGWLEGSAFPSWSGNSVLTGHVYGANGLTGPFVNLARLKYGDKIIVHAYGSKYIYEVRANTVVEPDDAAIFRHEEKAWLTLVTCKEYDEKTNTYKKRVVARAVLVGVEQ